MILQTLYELHGFCVSTFNFHFLFDLLDDLFQNHDVELGKAGESDLGLKDLELDDEEYGCQAFFVESFSGEEVFEDYMDQVDEELFV